MNLQFGTDGIRGPVETKVTPEACLRIGHAAGIVFKELEKVLVFNKSCIVVVELALAVLVISTELEESFQYANTLRVTVKLPLVSEKLAV